MFIYVQCSILYVSVQYSKYFFNAVCLEFNILILPHSQVYIPIYRIYSI